MDSVEAFTLVARNTPKPALLVGRDGGLLVANPAALLLLARNPGRLTDLTIDGLFSQDSGETLAAIRETLSSGPRMVTLHIDIQGQAVPMMCELVPVDANSVSIMTVAPHDYLEKIAALEREVQTRIKAESQRDELLASERSARAELEQAARVKDEFLATLSHELRTPLNAILGWTQYLSSPSVEAEEIADGLKIISSNARLQTELVNDLLDLSRVISGKMRLDLRPTDVIAATRAALATLQPAARARNIKIQSEASLQKVCDVLGDPTRLQQIMWNLLSNAIKFTPVNGSITLTSICTEDDVSIEITDTGEGISEAFLPHVFERFRQADSSTMRRHGGLGIGLAVVKHLVEMHGGQITARSPGLNQGSTFQVSFPRHRPQNAAPPSTDPVRLDGVRVLVVEDDPAGQTIMRRLLGQFGAHVEVVGTAADALVAIRERTPQIMVSDLGLPGEDGFSLMHRLRQMPADQGGRIPAIAVTAYGRDEDRQRTSALGFQQHLVKPVDPLNLIATVAKVLEHADQVAVGDAQPSIPINTPAPRHGALPPRL